MPNLSYEELERRLETQETLVECIQTLHSRENDMGVSITNVLSIVSGFYSAERVAVYELSKKERAAVETYSYTVNSDGGDEKSEKIKIGIENLKFFYGKLKESSEVFISEEDVSEIPSMKGFFSSHNIRNLLGAALYSGVNIFGFIVVLNMERNMDSPLLLQSIASFILNDIKQKKSFDARILQAVAATNVSMHLINLENDTFHGFKSSPHIDRLFNGSNSFNCEHANDTMKKIMTALSEDDFLNGLLRFVDLKTVAFRLEDRKIISHEFFGKVTGWCRANFIPVSNDMDGNLKYVIFSVQPIEEEKRRELEYQEILRNTLGNQNEIYTEMLLAQSAGIFSFKRETHEILMMNPATLNLFGWEAAVSANDNVSKILEKMESPKKDQIIEKILSMKNGDPEYTYEFSIHKSEKEFKWILGHAKVAKISNGDEIVINSFTDITANKKMETELFYLSQTDALTKISNRGSGESHIELLLKKGECGMFCLFDADKFKSINDNFGHSVGDEVLIEIANAMKKAFRGNDVIMRLGGDEFAVFAVGVTSEKIGAMIIERFFNCIDDISIKALRDRKIAVSLGAVFSNAEGESFDHLYQRADELLYECKKLPGCQYSFYHEEN